MISSVESYMNQLNDIQNSTINTTYLQTPDEPRIIIDANTREITVPPSLYNVAVVNDHNVETVYFEIDRYFDNVDLNEHTCVIQYVNANKEEDIYVVTQRDLTVYGKLIFGWTLSNYVTKGKGEVNFAIRFYTMGETDFTYNFNTAIAQFNILAGLNVRATEIETNSDSFTTLMAEITNTSTSIDSALANANSAAENATRQAELANIAASNAQTIIDNLDLSNVESGANTSLNPYQSLYFKDELNAEVYKVYFNNGVVESKNINTTPKVLSRISATKTKTVYNMDEPITVDDIIVTATYTDGTSAIVTNWHSNVDELDTFTEGLRKIIIYHTLDNITKNTAVYISVDLSVSANSKQYASVVNESGKLISGTELVTLKQKIFNRDKLNVRFKLRVLVTKNKNTSNTIVGLGNYSYWNSNTIKGITLSPNSFGEYLLEDNLVISYPQSNTDAGVPLLKIYNSSNLVEGTFNLEQMSIALIESATIQLSSITATKLRTRYFASDIINVNDISVTALYSNDTSATVTSFNTNVNSLDLSTSGDKSLIISYTENEITKYTTVTLNIYESDLTSPEPFTVTTAQELSDTITFGWNLGNNLDSKANGTKTFGEDKYLNQETAWFQPRIQKSIFPIVKAEGFNIIRIPVTWFYNSYIDSEGNRRIGKYFMARVREVIDYALEAGFYVILNSHHDMAMFYAGINSTSFAQVLKDAKSIWEDISNKFKHYSEKLIFESFNEIDNLESSWSFGAVAADQMNQMNQVFVDTVRASGSNNVNRVLIVPTLLDFATSAAYDAFVLPTDTVPNRIMVEIHTYPKLFLQNINPLFVGMEAFSARIGAPVIVGEWGTETKDLDKNVQLRAMHASNFVARAKAHNIKTIWWDNGTIPTSTTDFALIDRFTNTIIYGEILSAIRDGFYNNVAYAIPNQYIYTVDSIDKVDYLTLNKDTGSISNTYWGTLTTDFISVVEGNTFTAIVNRSGGATTDQIALGNIVFYDANFNYITGLATAYQTTNYTMVVPSGASYAKVSTNSPSKNVTLASFTNYLSSGALDISVSNYSLGIITEVDLGIKPLLTGISATKTIVNYNIGETVTLNDVVVTAAYADETSKTVIGWISNFDSLDFTTMGDKILIITYTEDDVTLTAELTISLKPHTELLYLQSSGTQYIDTGIAGQSGIKAEISWRLMTVEAGTHGVLGSNATSTTHSFSVTRSGNNVNSIYDSSSTFLGWNGGEVDIVVTKDDNLTYLDGVLKKTDTAVTFNNGVNMTIFAINNDSIAHYFETMRLYYCKIWDGGGTLIRDFVPVRKDTTYCLYDEVTQTYFYNQGTGEFTGI